MAKNLPPSWDPGYAQPPNVKAEGIQRRAFVTKWAPRGTYDATVNPTGGYAQPAYVMAEGSGQGAFNTDWVSSGSYMGPGIPHWMNQLPGMSAQYAKIKSGGPSAPSGAPLSIPSGLGGLGATRAGRGEHPYTTYGQKAATIILGNVKKLPVAQRKTALKKILNSVDPTLYDQVAKVASQHIANGVSPDAAVHKAMSATFTRGLTKEVVSLGKGRSPRNGGLLGLGMYGHPSARRGRGALGAAPTGAANTNSMTPGARAAGQAAPQPLGKPTTVNGVTVQDGQGTVDGQLVWSQGQWRIVTPDDPPIASTVALKAPQVITSGATIYVGMFPFKNLASGVVAYPTPASLGKTALQYIGQKITASWAAAACPTTLGGVPTTQLTTDFNPISPPIDTYGLPDNCTYRWAPQCSSTASLGTVIGGVQVTVGKDPSGFQCHIANGGSGVNYKNATYYDVCDWLQAAGIISSTDPAKTTTPWSPSRACKAIGILDGTKLCNMQHDPLASLFDLFQEVNYGSPAPADSDAPFFKFPHPTTGETWGVWLAFGLNSVDNATPGYPTKTGAPQSVHLEVGFAPIPGCDLCFLSDVLEFIFWLPGQIFIDATEAVITVVGGTLSVLGSLACDIMTSPGAVQAGAAAGGAIGGKAGQAAGGAGAAVAQAACGGPKMPSVPPPSNSWLLPVALLGLGAVVILSRPKKKASSSP